MDDKKPHARKKTVSSGGSGVHRRGEGLGTGKTGNHSYSSQSSGGSNMPKRAAAGGGGLVIILAALIMLMKGGIGGGNNNTASPSSSSSGGYTASSETSVDTSVAKGSRAKYTNIIGNGKDTVTVMIYMCGTDLESKYGMASSDMEEIRAASKSFGDNFNVIVYTGGCTKWKTSGVSSSVNQIYTIKNGKIACLEDNEGSDAMTDPNTLSSFIGYCSKNYPANRNELILWDHGGGSVSGYGYDEKNSKSGSMSLSGISKALKNGGVKFDFVGFDACLMATAENALMLNDYADYLIASEETEPGIGWYYTDWMTQFANNTSQSTLDVGKNIVDGFVTECAKKCKGQLTTLSVIDLAEFSNTVPSDFNDFSKSISAKISNKEYQAVSDARYGTREFASSSKIDQVDLVDLALNMGTNEGTELAESLKSAVKYNRTSSNMTNAYGVSVYFPYRRTSFVDSACSTYDAIGMDSEYSKCIRQFASLETSGQIAAGGDSSPIGSLFGSGLGEVLSSGGSDIIGDLLTSFLGGSSGRSISGLDSSNTNFMKQQDNNAAAEYIAENYFDASNLIWENNNGEFRMNIPSTQWELIHGVDKNMFYDDGNGYVDLGTDNVFTLDGDTLIADTERNWVSVNGQPVAYYHTDSVENSDGTYTDMGYSPAFLNGERVNVMIVFEDGRGYISGAVSDYVNGETDTVAKSLSELSVGDKLDFICDYYTYDMEYMDSYYLGDTITVSSDMLVTNTDVGEGSVKILYLFTDIYDHEYWSEAIDG